MILCDLRYYMAKFKHGLGLVEFTNLLKVGSNLIESICIFYN
jgi:hypothetical protein